MTGGRPDLVTIGEALAALRSSTPVRLGGRVDVSVAGAETNVAIGLARLGHRSRWVGVLGNDALGDLIRRTLTAEQIDVGHIRRTDRPTGIAVFEHRIHGLVRVDYHRLGSAGSTLHPDDVDAALADRPRILHVTGITCALGEQPFRAVHRAVELARTAGTQICLDLNYRSRLGSRAEAGARLRPLIGLVDVIVASDDEISLLADGEGEPPDLVNTLLTAGPREIVLTRGAAGAISHTRDGAVQVAARKVTAVDTVGAGDAFVAGYLSGLLDGLDQRERLNRGAACGAFAVASHGDWEGAPTRAELSMMDELPGSALR